MWRGEHMTTGQLTKATGLGRETLRFYEKNGLIPAPQRNESGYRIYPEDTIRRAEFIARAKEAGFTLSEIAATLALADENLKLDPRDFTDCIDRKISQVQKRIGEMEVMLTQLNSIRRAMEMENSCPVIKKIIG
jgi:MerR family mercuric resistance operon transcriptional regulator